MPALPNSLPNEFAARLAVTAAALPLAAPLELAQVTGLANFSHLLLKWNETLNLTGARSLADVVDEHLPDALVLAEEVPKGATVVDVGSGGGLPAIPLAVLRPDLKLTLVEPRAKRVAFLRTAARELHLAHVEVVLGRVEEWRAPGRPQVAISRATFPPEQWVALGSTLVGPSGLVFAFLNGSAGQGGQAAAAIVADQRRTYRLAPGQVRVLARFDVKG